MKSKAAITLGNGKFQIEEIEVGAPSSDEVLVEIKAAGLCHTDYDSMSWSKKMVLGHEGAGIIREVGDGVSELKAGDFVILNWAIPCLDCFQCNRGNQHLCEKNSPVIASGDDLSSGHAHAQGTLWNNQPIERSFNIGTISEYTLVKEAACVKVEGSQIPFAEASIISCGVMTGFGSVVNAAKVEKGTSVAVLGTGGVGLNVIQGAKVSQASKIIAIDIKESRLEMAKQFGATHTILAKKKDIGLLKASEEVRQMTDGRGADYAFECTAIPALGAAPLAMIRNAGTAVQVSGVEEEITIDMNLFEWDKIYINPLYGQAKPQSDFRKIVGLYEKGDLLLEEMISNKYSLDQLGQAFDDMLSGKNAKGVIQF